MFSLLNLISVILLIVLMYLSFYDLTFYQLPGVMLSFVFSFLIFYFIYYRINFSKNIYIRLLQKFVVLNLCFISSVLLASLLDLYIFQVFFSEVNINNVNDFINIVCSSPNESYEFKIPKKPIDIITRVPSPEPNLINSPLENVNESILIFFSKHPNWSIVIISILTSVIYYKFMYLITIKNLIIFSLIGQLIIIMCSIVSYLTIKLFLNNSKLNYENMPKYIKYLFNYFGKFNSEKLKIFLHVSLVNIIAYGGIFSILIFFLLIGWFD